MNEKTELNIKPKHEMKMNNYILKEVIETGTTSYVYKGVYTRTSETVAIKVISRQSYIGTEKKQTREDRILREALISFLLSHKNILQMREFFYTKEYFYLVFNYISGEQLLQKIFKHQKLSENIARKYFIQILNALNYCHIHNLVHRDIKIENILIDKNDNAILIDFGLANFYEKEGFMGTFCGTLYFAAPELLLGNLYKGPEVDVWSLGIVLYIMVCGKLPFDTKDLQLISKKMMYEPIKIDGISSNLKTLLLQMLNPNRNIRISISEIYKSSWVNASKPKEIIQLESDVMLSKVNPNTYAYLNYLFGGQFKKKDGSYYNSIHKIYILYKKKQKEGRWFNNRVDSIVDFISDKKIKVKNTFIRHWRGIKNSESVLADALENMIKEMGLVFEIDSGMYQCTLENNTFYVQLSQNVFNKAYGLDIKSKSKTESMKAIKKSIKSKFKQIFQPNPFVLPNNTKPITSIEK